MTMRIHKKSRRSGLNYGTLEARQVLTSILLPGANWMQSTFHIPVNETQTVLSDLTDAPEVSDQPENGELTFDESNGALVYRPNQGFAGKDTFTIEGHANNFTMNVWHSAYATPDWQYVAVGGTASTNVLANDYVFQESANAQNSLWGGGLNSRFSWRQDSTGLSIVDVTDASFGAVSISEDGRSLIFEAAEGYLGQQEVTYTLEDSRGFRTTGTVVFEVTDQSVDARRYVSEAQWQQEQIESWLAQNIHSLGSNGGYYPLQVWGIPSMTGGINADARVVESTFLVDADSSENAFGLSEGIDVQQGDIVKSQGDLLFYVTRGDHESQFASYLSIVDVSDSSLPTLLSTTGFESNVKDIFLDEGQVAVVLAADHGLQLHGYSNVKANTTLLLLDVSQPVTPSEVYQATIDGSYTEARLIGDQLYLISQHSPNAAYSIWQLAGEVIDPVSPTDYIDAILAKDDSFGLPVITVEVAGEQETVTVAFDQIVRREDGDAATLVTTFDVQGESGTPVDIDMIETDYVRTVYVNAESLYLFDSESVIKLSIAVNEGVEFSADGALAGSLLNQFAADEHNGVLRVAMTDYVDWSSDVRIFEQVGDSLNVIGSLEDIAPGEQIYSTTFTDDQVFVVTFRRVDPLFVIDMSDATAPTVTGELKIPGVSNYLQLIGDNILLAVGRDADAETGMQNDLQISLFDVADPENPQLLDRYLFAGGRSTYSPLIDWISGSPDHHALTFDQATGTLALPISQTLDEVPSFNVSVFKLNRENGIQFAGQVDFESAALRTVISGDRVVYFSEDSLKTAVVTSPTDVLATLELPPEESQAREVGASKKVCFDLDQVFEKKIDFAAKASEVFGPFLPTTVFIPALNKQVGIELIPLDLVEQSDIKAVEELPAWMRIVAAIETNTIMTESEKEIALEGSESAIAEVELLIDEMWMTFDDAFHDDLDRVLPNGFEVPIEDFQATFVAEMMRIDLLDAIALEKTLL